MLNEYLTNELLENEFLDRSWLLQNIEIDKDYNGGTVPVPFEGNSMSSIKFGSLTADTDVAEADFQRGTLAGAVEMWGSMLFRHRDIMDGHGKVKEKSFLDILPGQVNRFTTWAKEASSTQLVDGPVLATLTADGTAGGVAAVDKIDRFQIGQKCTIDDDNSAQADVYVIAVDVNTKQVTVSASRGGAALDISAYTLAQNAKLYHDGVLVGGTVTNAFENLRSILLSSTNGGASTVHGKTKATYPFLQAYNHSGATITAGNILDKLFDAMTEFRARARGGMPSKLVMSMKNLGSCMKAIEAQKGGFKVSVQSQKASQYGWMEIEIVQVKGGAITLVGIVELKDDVIFGLDLNSMKFMSVGDLFKKRTAPDGKQYFEVRSASAGYSYVLDVSLYGNLQVQYPGANFAIHSISY